MFKKIKTAEKLTDWRSYVDFVEKMFEQRIIAAILTLVNVLMDCHYAVSIQNSKEIQLQKCNKDK